jgi:hypothetical protein
LRPDPPRSKSVVSLREAEAADTVASDAASATVAASASSR